ncbi:hypothetical protein CIB48_g980 [Xylaria polymorpha]|nr:hypothetical protein CIB48_g980 [Xylaria polymorpha]
MPYLTLFTLFTLLPAELRLHIWRLSCHRRVVEVFYDQENDRCSTTAPVPAVLHACRESRYEALRLYRMSFGTMTHEPRIYFNREMDTLYIPRPPCMGYDDSSRSFADLIRDAHYISFPEVDEVFLVTDTPAQSDDSRSVGELGLTDPIRDALILNQLLEDVKASFYYEVRGQFAVLEREEATEPLHLPPLVLKSKIWTQQQNQHRLFFKSRSTILRLRADHALEWATLSPRQWFYKDSIGAPVALIERNKAYSMGESGKPADVEADEDHLEPEKKKRKKQGHQFDILSPSGDSDKENWSPDSNGNPNHQHPLQAPEVSASPTKQAAALSRNPRRVGRILGEQDAATKRLFMNGSVDVRNRHANRANTAPTSGQRSRKPGDAAVAIFEDGENAIGDEKGERFPRVGKRDDEEVESFMRGELSPSKRPDMDCVAGLLSLSQGNWR